MSGSVRRYGAILDDLLKESDEATFTHAVAAADLLATLVTEHPPLMRLFSSPLFSEGEKSAVIAELSDRRALPGPVTRIFSLLVAKRRPGMLAVVVRDACRLRRSRSGIVDIEVRSAVPLSDDDTAALSPTLERMFGPRLHLERTVDPTLLGGILVRRGNTLYDASLKNHLRMLADSLRKGEPSHV